MGGYKFESGKENPNYKHGLRNHKLYNVWNGINNRCNNSNHERYSDYGGRGISLCSEWNDFVTFYTWSIDNGYTDGLELDRSNNDNDYCPDNCRWTTPVKQARNRRSNRYLTAFNETKLLCEWPEDIRCKVGYKTLHKRLKDGWSNEDAITTILQK